MSSSTFAVFDPRIGQSFEWRAKDGEVLLSGAGAGVFVIEATKFEWPSGLVSQIFASSGTYGVVAVSPWAPGIDALVAGVHSLVPSLIDVSDVSLGTFLYSSVALQQLWDLRQDHGGALSGEWLFASLLKPIRSEAAERRAKYGGTLEALALSDPAALGAAILQREFGTLLVVRMNPAVEPLLDELLKELDARGTRTPPEL